MVNWKLPGTVILLDLLNSLRKTQSDQKSADHDVRRKIKQFMPVKTGMKLEENQPLIKTIFYLNVNFQLAREACL